MFFTTQVVGSYIVLRRLIGPFLGFVLPFILSTYEILCTSVVVRVFTSEFVTLVMNLFGGWVNFFPSRPQATENIQSDADCKISEL